MESLMKPLVVITLFHLISANLEKDLRLLSRILPGIYSNREQYLKDASLPSDKRHKSVQAIFRPVQISFMTDAFNIYVEKFSNYNKKPFKQWIYSFETNHTQKAIKLKIYDILNDDKRKMVAHNVKAIARINMRDLHHRPQCDLTWRKSTGKTFHGTTSRNCLANPSGEKVQIVITASLTARGLQWQEGWFRLSDGSPMLSSNGPYIYQKVKKIKGQRYQPRLVKRIKSFEREHRLKSIYKRTKYKQRKHLHLAEEHKHILADGHVYFKTTRIHYISSYAELKDAILSGSQVHFHANMSTCVRGGATDEFGLVFGGYIDVYDITNREEMIRFSTTKRTNLNYEIRESLNEIRVYKDGTIVVDMYQLDVKDGHVIQQSMGVCKIYDPRVRSGSISFSILAKHNPDSVLTFGNLLTALIRGERIRMVADLSLCSNAKTNLKYVSGVITDYTVSKDETELRTSFGRKFTNIHSIAIVNFRNIFLVAKKGMKANLRITEEEPSKHIENTFSTQTYRCDTGINSSARSVTFYKFTH